MRCCTNHSRCEENFVAAGRSLYGHFNLLLSSYIMFLSRDLVKTLKGIRILFPDIHLSTGSFEKSKIREANTSRNALLLQQFIEYGSA